MKDLAAELDKLNEKKLFRSRRLRSSAQEIEPVIDGQKLLSFCSNDYLGLANHPKVTARFLDAAKKYGIGTGASHLITGHHTCHAALEEALAAFLGCEKAILFSTGYMANLGTVSALASRNSTLFADKLNHASLNDAAILSRAILKRYAHRNTEQLEKLICATPKKELLILSDGVFSMDGTLAPVQQLQALSEKYSARLIIDDAHGIGVLGDQGLGCTQDILSANTILIGTLGKAFGTFGAFVSAKQETIEWLIQKAHSYLYTTALPPAIAAASLASLQLIREEPWRREKVQEITRYFRRCCEQLNIRLTASSTPIQPIIVNTSGVALHHSNALLEAGILVPAIRPPTVAADGARLRVTFCAQHTHRHIDSLLEQLSKLPGLG